MSHLRLVEQDAAPAAANPLPPFIPRLGLNDGFLLREFAGFGTPVIARTIAQHNQDAGLTRAARQDYRLEVLIDPDTWRNQQPVKSRTAGFQKASFAVPLGRLDLLRRTLSPDEMDNYVRATFADTAAAHATIWVAPYHLGRGPDCPIRQTDLKILRRAVRRFRSARLNEPRANDPSPVERRLFAGIAIHPRDLVDPMAREILVRLYADIAVDGYLVKFEKLTEASTDVHAAAVASFISALRFRTGRDIILAGGKNLALAIVAAGVASALMGIAEGEVFSTATGGKRQGTRPFYCSPLWRSIQRNTDASQLRAGALLRDLPCECGHHRADEWPADMTELRLHTMSLRLRDFAEVAAWPEAEATPRLRRRTREIDELARPLGYAPCPSTFVVVSEAADRARRDAAERIALGHGDADD